MNALKGVYQTKVTKITVLGRMNDVNVNIEMLVDYPNGVSGIDVVKDITSHWHAAGLEPPVPGNKQNYRTTGERNGAKGTHPDDIKPFYRGTDQEICPNCGKPLYYVKGITKNPDSQNFGNEWVKWFCPEKFGGCGAYNFGDRKDARFDKK